MLLSSDGTGLAKDPVEGTRPLKVTPVVLATKIPEAPKSLKTPAPKPRKRPRASLSTESVATRPLQAPSQPQPRQKSRPVPKPSSVSRPSAVGTNIPRAYPTARRSPAAQREESKPSSVRRPTETAPLWVQEAASPTPQPGPSQAASPIPAPPESPEGDGDSRGVVSEPTPIGVLDPGVDVASFKALASAYVEVEFTIEADGSASRVTLLRGTGIPQVDVDLVAYFKSFRWNPKLVGGVAVSGSQSMDFQVESRK